jgi:hypothetical protein
MMHDPETFSNNQSGETFPRMKMWGGIDTPPSENLVETGRAVEPCLWKAMIGLHSSVQLLTVSR